MNYIQETSMISTMMNLKTDIHSHMHEEIIYGRQGDLVKLITDDGQVCIVEDKYGKRFPCRKEKLSEIPVAKIPDSITDQNIIINKGKGRKKAIANPAEINSLF